MLKSNKVTKAMYQYLFENNHLQYEYPFKNNFFKFLLLRFENSVNNETIFDLLDELIPDNIVIRYQENYLVFYFNDLDFEVKDLVTSISDDFSSNIFIYSSGRISKEYPNHFKMLYDAILKYLGSTSFRYVSNTELVIEIIKNSISELVKVKPAILNNLHEDSQIEKIMHAMFENNLNVTQTANTVYMHRNTIINKLEFIKQETGLNLQNFTDALCLYWLFKIK